MFQMKLESVGLFDDLREKLSGSIITPDLETISGSRRVTLGYHNVSPNCLFNARMRRHVQK